MSVNRHKPHVVVIPEDDADRQIAQGFVLHSELDDRQIQIMPPAKGWPGVLEKFNTEYIRYLRNSRHGFAVLLIDFDEQVEFRRKHFEDAIPDDLKDRVFVLGPSRTPESLSQAFNNSLESIGTILAEECFLGTSEFWNHAQLQHNAPDRKRLDQAVKPFLFPNR